MEKWDQKWDFPGETFERLFFGGYLDPMEHINEEFALSHLTSRLGHFFTNLRWTTSAL